MISSVEYIQDGPFLGLKRNGYGAILADPPWHFKTYNEKGRRKCPDWRNFKGSPALHYETMDLKSIKSLPVGTLAQPNCALFLWGCWATMPQALEVIEAWGFTFKTCAFLWMKTGRMGLGYWTRQQTEFCLFATRGRPRRLSRSVRQEIVSPRREHSRKPNEILRPRIEQLVAGPYVELFCRDSSMYWDCWGRDVGMFPLDVAAE